MLIKEPTADANFGLGTLSRFAKYFFFRSPSHFSNRNNTLELKGKTRTILESISRDRRAAIRAVKGRVRINCNTMFPLLRDVLLPLAHVHICVKIGHQKVISRRGEGREERDRITFPLCELSPRDRGTLCSTNFSPSRALMKRSFGSK